MIKKKILKTKMFLIFFFNITRFDLKSKMKKIQHLSKFIAIKNQNKIKIKKSRNNKFEFFFSDFLIYI